MTNATQKRLAIAGALAALGVFVAANAHLIGLAFKTQPACVVVAGDAMPAKRAC